MRARFVNLHRRPGWAWYRIKRYQQQMGSAAIAMASYKDLPEISFDDPARHALTQHSTWVSVAVNILLTAAQVVAGILAHSQGLIADGLHSLSDLVCDFLVLVAAHFSKDPADESHPYGHARVETAASFALGAILAATGAGIIWGAGIKLQNLDNLPPVAPFALWIAILALVAKEGLFRYMLHYGERLRSPMLIANAWHARSDAASSLVVALGIGGNLMGFNFADSIAAVIVGFMIVRMGAIFSWDAVRELIDTGLSIEEVDGIRQIIVDTSGVTGLHELRTRRMAHRSLVDAHISRRSACQRIGGPPHCRGDPQAGSRKSSGGSRRAGACGRRGRCGARRHEP